MLTRLGACLKTFAVGNWGDTVVSETGFWKIKREFRRFGYQITHPQLLFPYIARKILLKQLGASIADQYDDLHFTKMQKTILKFLGSASNGWRLVDVKGRSQITSEPFELAAPGEFRCEEPRCLGQRGTVVSGDFPALNANVVEKSICSPVSSSIYSRGTAYIPDHYVDSATAVVSDGKFLLWHGSDGSGLVDMAPPEQLKRGICLFGSGCENWYHWLIEVLPAAYLAQRLPEKYDDYPFLVARKILDMPQFSQALDVLRGARDIVALDRKLYRVNKLIMIDQMVCEPINMRVNHWPKAEDYAYNPDLILDYRKTLMDGLGVGFNPPTRKLFLARGHSRRSYNQDELLQIAESYGFEAFYPEKHSFKEQVETFAQAKCIVGPSGAAFANSIFCQKDTRLLSWLVSNYSGFCSYSNIATTVGTHLRYMFVDADTEIKSTFDAYNATYHVDEAQFEQTIEKMVTSSDW